MALDRRTRTVRDALSDRGYNIDVHDDTVVAHPTSDADRIGVPGAVHLVPGSTDPTTLLEAIGSASNADRTALLAVHPDDVDPIREVLTDPPGLFARSDRSRTFYSVPDRLSVGNKGLACCRADADPVWHEERVSGVTGDGPRFVLRADDRTVTVFETFEALACPAVDAFDYVYRRGSDGRFRVRKLQTGRTVGRFSSIRELRANAYRPVPVPLVPERVVDGYLPEAWAIATVSGDRITGIDGA